MGTNKKRSREKGRPITFADTWIAAAALQLNVPLVTHNARDYAGIQNLAVLTSAATV
jgi:predicted nucleic acid-binding protein